MFFLWWQKNIIRIRILTRIRIITKKVLQAVARQAVYRWHHLFPIHAQCIHVRSLHQLIHRNMEFALRPQWDVVHYYSLQITVNCITITAPIRRTVCAYIHSAYDCFRINWLIDDHWLISEYKLFMDEPCGSKLNVTICID